MTQKQADGLATHPGVPPRGPCLSLPMRKGVEKLCRAPTRGNAGPKAKPDFTPYLWAGTIVPGSVGTAP